MDMFLARQPIFDRTGEVAGYELLYRRAATSQSAGSADRDLMARQVLVNAFLGVGIERITEGRPAFINVTREMLLSGAIDLLDPALIVVEVLEGIQPDRQIVEACAALVDRGYRLALDDFTFSHHVEPLLLLADVVKVDVLQHPGAELEQLVRQIQPFGLQLLAEKVEHREAKDQCVRLGFELFQGYLFSRPQTIANRDLSVEQLRAIGLMKTVRDMELTDHELVREFEADVSLSYKLLRMVNSASVGARGVRSIPHAVRLLGREAIYRWLILLVASSGSRGVADPEILNASLLRARLCELLAHAGRRPLASGSLYLAGLLSVLDILLGMPMEELVTRMDLAPEVQAALVGRRGPYGTVLALVEAYDNARWQEVTERAAELDISTTDLSTYYLESIAWARERTPTPELLEESA
jgi:c-di-GMP phosphodiesterase